MHRVTNRLILRDINESDAPSVQQLASDFEIARTTLHIPHPYPENGAIDWIERTQNASQQGVNVTAAVTSRSDETFFGVCSLGIAAQFQAAELGYWIGRPFWGRGYMTEAAMEMVRYGFEELGLNKIFARAFTDNPASTRVMQKIGMQYEGTLRQHVMKLGNFKDLACYGILKSEYESQIL